MGKSLFKEPAEREAVVNRAVGFCWGPSKARLEALASEPFLEAQFALLGLQRRTSELGDERASELLDAAWESAFGLLNDAIRAKGYTALEHGTIIAALNAELSSES